MRFRMQLAALSAAVLLAACASSSPNQTSSKAPVAEPQMQLVQLSDTPLAAVHVTGPLSIKYQLQFHNTSTQPITLKHLQLESMGYGAYTLRPTSTNFNAPAAPDQTVAVEFWMPATVAMDTVAGNNGPVTIRGMAQFDSPAGSFQKVWTQQVHEYGDVSGGH